MSRQSQFETVSILGVAIDVVSVDQAIAFTLDRAANGPAGYVVKPYVEFLDRATDNPELAGLINEADLALADGVSLQWAAAYLYAGRHTLGRLVSTLAQIVVSPHELKWPLPERAAGINFTWPLLQRAAQAKLRVYLVGSPRTQTLPETARHLQEQIPDLQIIGTAPGDGSDSAVEQLISQIKIAKPDLILVGMGWPLQETLMVRLVRAVNHGIFVGEGGTFDYEQFGGKRPKAPRWLQRVGLEWLWRLILEPTRLKRQLAIPRFIWRVWRAG